MRGDEGGDLGMMVRTAANGAGPGHLDTLVLYRLRDLGSIPRIDHCCFLRSIVGDKVHPIIRMGHLNRFDLDILQSTVGGKYGRGGRTLMLGLNQSGISLRSPEDRLFSRSCTAERSDGRADAQRCSQREGH